MTKLLRRVFDDSVEGKPYSIVKDGASTIVKINKSAIDKLATIVADTNTNRETIQSMCKRKSPDFIINGGFFWTDNQSKSHSINLLIADSKQNNAGNPNFSRFGLMVHDDNKISFADYKWSRNLTSMIGGSPAIIKGDKLYINHRVDGDKSRHPRSAIGMTDKHIVLYTEDGRNPSKGRIGMTIQELANKLLELGCTDAIALDGGGSTRLHHRDSVLNSPTENRPVHNAIGIWLK